MPSERDSKYADNGDTKGLTQRDLILEVRQDLKDVAGELGAHLEKGHTQHPTWVQLIGLVGALAALAGVVLALAG
jgi:hypothetical protein